MPVAYRRYAKINTYSAQLHHSAVCLLAIKQIAAHTNKEELKIRAKNRPPVVTGEEMPRVQLLKL